MPYIPLRPDLYGITSLLDFRPEIAAPLCRLTQLLLRGKSSKTEAEREMIAAHVSSLNECKFCSTAHTAATCLLPGGRESGIEPMQSDLEALDVSDKMKCLLRIAAKLQKNGNQITQEDIDLARQSGIS